MAAIDPSDIAKLVSGIYSIIHDLSIDHLVHQTTFCVIDFASILIGYLRDQKLKSAYVEFCKTSPFLEAEYTQVQAGYRTVHFIRPSLIDTLKEFCRIEMTGKIVIQFSMMNMRCLYIRPLLELMVLLY